MAATSATVQAKDDTLTVCAISALSAILADVLHEGVGHAAAAFLLGAQSGVLSTVAWSSEFDSRLVAAGGTLVNLAAGMIFWIALRQARGAAVRWRYFLLTSVAFNLFTGTGYFFFSGVTNFGDWAAVIAGLPAQWIWRTILVVAGAAAYFWAVLVVGNGLVRYVAVPSSDLRRLRRLTSVPYFSAVLLLSLGGLLNPIGMQLMWESALPASAGADSGLLWLRFYIPEAAAAERSSDAIGRSYAWMATAAVLSALFILVLGRGIPLHR